MLEFSMMPSLRDGDCEAEDRFVFGFVEALMAAAPVGVGRVRAQWLAQALLDEAEVAACLPCELDRGSLAAAVTRSGLHRRNLSTVESLLRPARFPTLSPPAFAAAS